MWRLAPTLLSVVGAVVYLVLGPRSPDLAAHVFRSELFGREGFTIWTGQWYSGHHTPAYSVLSPPLGWLLGPQLLGAASSVAATACFEAITRRHYGTRSAAWGAVWFGVASVTLLFTARLTFSLGVAFGLAALLALQRRRPRSAVAAGGPERAAGRRVDQGAGVTAGRAPPVHPLWRRASRSTRSALRRAARSPG